MSLPLREKLIFEYSRPGRGARGQWPPLPAGAAADAVPEALRRRAAAAAARGQRAGCGAPLHPPVAAEFLDRYAFLSARLLHDEVQPQGLQCRGAAAGVPGAASARAGRRTARGSWPACTSCRRCSRRSPACAAWRLSPLAGAHGEFAGVAMIRAYHRARGDLARNEIIVPQAAHGTNPATATMCGCVAREVAVGADGDVDLEALRAAVGPKTAGIMLTNPSTLGVFERRIEEVARIVHAGRRPALLRRRQSQRDPRQGAAGRHGLRCHPHEPAQDLLHAARRRRPRRRRGRRVGAAAAVPAAADRRARAASERAVSLARASAICRSRSAG